MTAPPTWSPKVGERHEDWIGVAAGSVTFWDRYTEEESAHKVEGQAKATTNGLVLPADKNTFAIDSASTDAFVVLPSIQDQGVGNPIYLQSIGEAYRIRCQNEDGGDSEFINDFTCSSINELFVPARAYAQCTPVGKQQWAVQLWSSEGIPLSAIPRTRNNVNVITEHGYQEVTPTPCTEVYTEYDGTDDYHTDDYLGTEWSGASFSIGAWIYTRDIANFKNIAGVWSDSAPEFSWIFRHDDGGNVEFYVSTNGTTTYLFQNSTVLTANTWTHVMAIFDGSTTGVDFYLNNSADGTPTTAGATTIDGTSTSSFKVGAYRDTAAYFWDGYIAHLTIEEALWDSSARSNLYNRCRPPTGAHYWPVPGKGEKRQRYSTKMLESSYPKYETEDNITRIDNNTKVAYLKATTQSDLTWAPQLRAGQTVRIHGGDQSSQLLFPKSVNGRMVEIAGGYVSDWHKSMQISDGDIVTLTAITDELWWATAEDNVGTYVPSAL